MGPLELDGAPGEEPMGPLENVVPLKQEPTGPFGDHGPLKLAGPLEYNVAPRAPKCVMHM